MLIHRPCTAREKGEGEGVRKKKRKTITRFTMFDVTMMTMRG